MSQHDFDIANQGFPATRADLNNALKAAVSNSAGTSAPSTTYAYQFWYDSTNNIIKMRNGDNDAWISVATVDQTNDLVSITHTGMLDLVDDDGSASIRFQAPSTVTSTTTFTLPDGDGDSGQTLITNGSGTLSWHAPYGNRNILINGSMAISQRGTSFATMGNGDSQYTLDRFRWSESGSPTLEMTVTQDSSSPDEMGNSKSLKVEVTTAQSSLGSGDRVRIEQYIEAQNCQSIAKGTSAAKALSASFWVKSSKTGTYIVELQENDNDRINSQSYSISSANTWEYKTLTFPADTTGAINNDNGNGITFRMYLCAGTDYTSGSLNTSWVGVSGNNTGAAVGQVNLADTVNATWFVTALQLEVGSVPTPFEHEDYSTTLRKCQRYFELIGMAVCRVVGTTQVEAISNFKVDKRAGPTIALKNTSGAVAEYLRSAANITALNSTFLSVTTHCGNRLTSSDTAMNDGNLAGFLKSDALSADAEL